MKRCFSIDTCDEKRFYRNVASQFSLGITSTKTMVQEIKLFPKIKKNPAPFYLYNLMPTSNNTYRARNGDVPYFNMHHYFFIIPFLLPPFLYGISQTQISQIIQISISSVQITYENQLRPVANSIFKEHNPKEIRFLARLGIEVSHLCQQFQHSFQDTLSRIYRCSNNIETKVQHLLQCSSYSKERSTLQNKLRSIDSQFLR